jgi:transposase
VLREAARWLDSLGVTHVAMEATGIYSMPVYHALIEHGNFAQVLVCNAAHVKNVPGRKTDLLTELVGSSRRSQACRRAARGSGRVPGAPFCRSQR